MQMINDAGFKGEYFLYTMVGGKNDFEECYNRIHYWWQRLQDFRHDHIGRAVYAYAQPYRDPMNSNHAIPQWQKDLAAWCNKRMLFCKVDFKDFSPRKSFTCQEYLLKLKSCKDKEQNLTHPLATVPSDSIAGPFPSLSLPKL